MVLKVRIMKVKTVIVENQINVNFYRPGLKLIITLYLFLKPTPN